MGHHFSDHDLPTTDLYCTNERWLTSRRFAMKEVEPGTERWDVRNQLGEVCGVSWQRHQERPRKCRFDPNNGPERKLPDVPRKMGGET